MRILIVEDNPKIRELLRELLGDMAEVFECADGDEVLAAFSNCHPDWVVMDVRMERLGGIAATQLLKKEYPRAQIVMLSKHRDDDIRSAARAAGASGYLIKDDLSALKNFLLETVEYPKHN